MYETKITSLWTGADNNLHARLSNGQEKLIAAFTNEASKSYFEDLLIRLKQMI
jgi:hypothetical protein